MKKRESNFELLRIVLMLLIIVGHLLLNSEKLGAIGTKEYYITNIMRSFTVFGVNGFILLSGYFGINLNYKKLIRLDIRILFYTWIFFVIGIVSGIHQINIIKDILLIFPVITKRYWFITDYFVLCILSPFLNKFIQSLDREELKKLLLISGIIFYLIATFCFMINADQIVNDSGYGMINFIYLYFIGFYLKHYYKDEHSSIFYFSIYGIISIMLFVVNWGMTKITGFYFDSLISYNTIFVLGGAISLFLAFKNLKIPTYTIINRSAAACLSIYVIHTNPTISQFMFCNILKINQITGIKLIPIIFVQTSLIYVICYVIDIIIDKFFSALKIDQILS